jgi:hypothetical protein
MAYLSPYWVTFSGSVKAGCIEAFSEAAAKEQADKLGTVATLKRIPYPANPRLSESHSDCPPFCHSPRQCQGRTACPQSYACSE